MEDDFASVRELAELVAIVEKLTQARVKHRSPGDVRLAPCPFCGSKTGFSVNPQTKAYFCHHAGCGAKGDIFTFVERVRGVGKGEALRILAEDVGYRLEALPPTRLGIDGDRLRDPVQEIKRIAAEYYSSLLWEKRDEPLVYRRNDVEHRTTVLGYQTETRCHSEGVLKYMRVGWSDGGLLNHLKQRFRDRPENERKLTFAAFLASGLIRKRDAGYGDLIRPGGYVYPVCDGGTVVTFTLKFPGDDVQPYQLPRHVEIDGESYDVWGRDCYFLNMDALDADELVVVEGENDLLSVMDLGRHPAVIGLRGQPKREQLECLATRRRGKRTYLALDHDQPGADMAWLLSQALAGPDFDVRIIHWESGATADAHEDN